MSLLFEITEEQVTQLAEAYSDYRAAQKTIWSNGKLSESSRLDVMTLATDSITLRHIQRQTGVELVHYEALDYNAKAVENRLGRIQEEAARDATPRGVCAFNGGNR
tara:strand:+ start:228 stop:545 length:318 start_codon:yes stop_codon:yes gene_type:complete